MGECHYQDGNYNAEKRLGSATRLLENMGIDQKRFRLEWISASEGAKFAEVMRDFTEQLKGLGPLDKGGEKAIG